MEKWKKRSVELITSLLFGGKVDMNVMPLYPQKYKVSERERPFFKRSLPEKKGISSRRIYNMLCELESERRAGVHSLMVLCDGDVICECSADGYSVNEWHVSHSMSKTVLGMVIGKLVDDRKIDLEWKVSEIFPEIAYKDKRFPLITVEHLLSMTSGVDFAEAGAVTERDWTVAFFSSVVRFVPGTKFAYNSMNSYVLARIAERVTGRSFGSLADEYIFDPLGITNYLWERGPEGTEKGGWGLYMSAESWAKVGYMLHCDGVFMGKRILSEEWVHASSTVKAISPESMGNFNYAYQMWVGRDNREILFNGMLGQNVWICPKNNIIAVVTSGNNEFFQDSPALEIIRKYLGGTINDEVDQKSIRLLASKQQTFFNSRRWVHPRERGGGFGYFMRIKSRTAFDTAWNEILGNYVITKNNATTMPLILRVIQNSLNSSIDYVRLYRVGEELILAVREGGEEITIKIGLYGYKNNLCDLRGEKYIIRALGEAVSDPDGNIVYKIELIFPETANTRMIVIKKKDEGIIRLFLSEKPNHRLAENVLHRYRETSGAISFAADLLERRIGERELESLINRVFNPMLIGVSTSLLDHASILKKENERFNTESGTIKIIRALVDRFFKENNE